MDDLQMLYATHGVDLTSTYTWDYDLDVDWAFVSIIIPQNWVISGVALFEDELACLFDNAS